MRFVGAATGLILVVVVAGCGVGDDGNKSADANANGEVCAATLKTSGSFTPGTPGRPIDPDTGLPITGCWPVGVWTFTAQVDNMGECKTAPTLQASYSFRVDRMNPPDGGNDYIESYTLLAGGDGMQTHVHVSAEGAGCDGALELGSMDGTQYMNLQPHLGDTGTTLNGKGDYILYKADAWPWKM